MKKSKVCVIILFFTCIFFGLVYAEDITITSNTTWNAGTYTYDNVQIANGVTLTFNGKVTLTAQSLSIDSTSSISADGKGYSKQSGPGAGGYHNYRSDGGSYGGRGGGNPSNLIYGSAMAPIDLGSGGGEAYSGAGGGAIKITVLDTLNIQGKITANGENGAGGIGSGGSGGSVFITTNTLTGAGTFTVNGGSGVNGGGGGRIAIYYKASTFTGNVEAKGATGAENGTVVNIDTANNILYTGHTFRFQEDDSPFNFAKIILNSSQVTSQGSASITTPQLLLSNNSSFILNGSTVIKTDNLGADTNSVLTLNDTSSLAVTNDLTLASSSLKFAAAQSLSASSLNMNNSTLILSGKETLNIIDASLINNSTVTHLLQGKINLNLKSLFIDSTSSISANEVGYPKGAGPGAGVYVNGFHGGGSYGGKGGGNTSGSVYGSALTPIDLGSGGYGSGTGGGAIKITVFDTLNVQGKITANGTTNAIYGGGSGGSIFITANVLTGAGSLTANGGSGRYNISGGGGGRIAIYYKASTFTGNVEAKGATGAENGTVVIKSVSLDTPLTFFNLQEKSSIANTFNETISAQKILLNNVSVTGGLNGTMSFTDFNIVKINSGSFVSQGFFKAQYQAQIEGATYQGICQGIIYSDLRQRKIYLQGKVSGGLKGICQMTLAESVSESNIYDKYESTWQLSQVGVTSANISTSLNLTGSLTYETPYTFTSQFSFYQSDLEGTACGSYSGPMSAVLTSLKLTSDNEYKGEGFSFISYNANLGQGKGYSYDKLSGLGVIDLQGLFDEALLGELTASFNENLSPKTLNGVIERLDLGSAPAANLKLNVFGPQRVSPGQTFDYLIELRNDGVKAAEGFKVIDDLPWPVEYLSDSCAECSDELYDKSAREVIFSVDSFNAKKQTYLLTKTKADWGLNQLLFKNIVYIPQEQIELPVDSNATVSGTLIDTTANGAKARMVISNQETSVELIAEITQEPATGYSEPKFGKNITADRVEYHTEFTTTNGYLSGTPSLAKYTAKIAAQLSGEGSIPAQISGAMDTVDKAIKILNTIKGYQQDTRMANNRKAFFDCVYDQGRMSREDYDIRKGALIAQRSLRPVIILMGELAGKGLFFPLPGNSAIDDIQETMSKSVMKSFCNTTVAEQLVLRVERIKDCREMMEECRKSRGEKVASHTSIVTTARDPNEMLVSPTGNIKPGDKLTYTINYENEGEGVAYGVYITNSLENDLDDATLIVGNGGSYDSRTRTIKWFIGEVGSKQKGSVFYDVNAKSDLVDNTEIINFATVYFPSVPEETRTNGVVNTVKTYIDNIAPITQIQITPSVNESKWNNSDIAIILTAVDNENGVGIKEIHYAFTGATQNEQTIISDTANFTITNEGVTTLTYYAIDKVGNVEEVKTQELKIDRNPPSINAILSPQSNLNGWNNTDTVVAFNGVDNLSGLKTITEPVSVITEGRDQYVGGQAIDVAGNSVTTSVIVNLDRTPPVIVTDFSPQPNANGWNNSDVKLTFTAEDNLSGVETVTAPVIVASEGKEQAIEGIAKDLAGNQIATIAKVNIDKTVPIITGMVTTIPNENGWYNNDVVIYFKATDTISNIDKVTADTTITMEGTNQDIEGTATDKAGNSATYLVAGINLDKTFPQVIINAPVNEGAYFLNQNLIANWTAVDSLSGLESATATVPNGQVIDTIGLGVKTFSVSAKDKAGNFLTHAIKYYIRYNYLGILPPVKPDGSSVFKLGRTVPIKFQLKDARGNYVVTAIAKIYLAKISDNVVGEEVDGVSPGEANTGNLFRYDSIDNLYIFNLSTNNLSTGTWQVRIVLDDGTSQYVSFGVR